MADEFMSGFMAGQNDNGGKDDGMGGGFMMIFLLVILAMSGGGGGLFGGGKNPCHPVRQLDLCRPSSEPQSVAPYPRNGYPFGGSAQREVLASHRPRIPHAGLI